MTIHFDMNCQCMSYSTICESSDRPPCPSNHVWYLAMEAWCYSMLSEATPALGKDRPSHYSLRSHVRVPIIDTPMVREPQNVPTWADLDDAPRRYASVPATSATGGPRAL